MKYYAQFRAHNSEKENTMINLTKVEWEEYKDFNLKRKYGIMDCERKEVFRLDAERIVVCHSYNPIGRSDGIPCGDNTSIHIMTLINLATGKSKGINSYYSEWMVDSPKYRSNEEWCRDCIAKGKLEK